MVDREYLKERDYYLTLFAYHGDFLFIFYPFKVINVIDDRIDQ